MKIKYADKTNAPLKPAAHFYGGCRESLFRSVFGCLPDRLPDRLPGRALYGRRMVAGWRLWEELPDVPMCCRAGCYTGVGWSPGGVYGQDCPTGRLDDCRTSAGRVPGMAAGGYSRLFRVSGCCRTTTGATGRRSPAGPFPGPVTRLFLRPPATGFLPRPVCGSDRGKSSRV